MAVRLRELNGKAVVADIGDGPAAQDRNYQPSRSLGEALAEQRESTARELLESLAWVAPDVSASAAGLPRVVSHA